MNQQLTERGQPEVRIQHRPETVYMPISEIKIGPRFRKDLGDIASLAASIQKVGLLHPIVVGESSELIAGLRRIRACERLGWREIPVHIVNLSDPQDAEIEENLKRKDFTASEIVAIKRALEPGLRAAAKKRQQSGKRAEESARGRPRDKIAAVVGVSHDTVAKAERIVTAAEKEPRKYGNLLEKVDAGKASINAAYRKISGQTSHGQKERNNTQPSSSSEPLITIEDLSARERRILERLTKFARKPTSLKMVVLTIIHDYCRRAVGGDYTA
jgi:ParB/RepB/Spo0J family partition protein